MVSAKAVPLGAEIVRAARPPKPEPGDGTEGNPFRIYTAEKLAGLLEHIGDEGVGKYFRIMNEIPLTNYLSPGSPGNNGGAGWKPIGNWDAPFRGNLNGSGYKVTGLWIDRPDIDFIGLFGRIDGGSVKNLVVEIAANGIKGNTFVGGLIGDITNGNIINCSASGGVSGAHFVGGLVGHSGGRISDVVNIRNCFATGDVFTGLSPVGGLIGYSGSSGAVEECYATGGVSCGGGSDEAGAGGLIGYAAFGAVNNCYAKGSVTNSGDAGTPSGGLSGAAGAFGRTLTIENCYAAGHVSGGGNLGGFIGLNIVNTSIASCFFDGDSTGQADGVGVGSDDGVTGKTTAEMKLTGTFTGWNFSTIWAMGSGINSGYPYLRAVPPF